jgi:hypothetical protein
MTSGEVLQSKVKNSNVAEYQMRKRHATAAFWWIDDDTGADWCNPV